MPRPFRLALGALILVGGIVHLQQYLDGFSSLPLIGPMFLVNAAASALLAGVLIWRSEAIWVVAAGLLAAGSLGAIFISRSTGLFGYMSVSFEAPEAVAVASEAAALVLAGLILTLGLHHGRTRTT